VRGINCPARHEVVRNLVKLAKSTVFFLQETKVATINDSFVGEVLGQRMVGYSYLPANHTRGGILVGWNEDLIEVTNIMPKVHSLTMNTIIRESSSAFLPIVVYGPSDDTSKPEFLQELQSLKPHDSTTWLVVGDFNLIYQASDKNNQNLNRKLMGSFRHTLNRYEFFEFNLQNRKFTWSNERENPTLVRLDRMFCNKEWDLMLPDYNLNALSSSLSDHCSLMLWQQVRPRVKDNFRFEIFWTNLGLEMYNKLGTEMSPGY
jgi:exonuclease III